MENVMGIIISILRLSVTYQSAEPIAFLWSNPVQNSFLASIGEPYEPALT